MEAILTNRLLFPFKIFATYFYVQKCTCVTATIIGNISRCGYLGDVRLQNLRKGTFSSQGQFFPRGLEA